MSSYLITVTFSIALLMMPNFASDTGPAPEKTPVLVELFTSEGCSSCPPADALLRELQSTQPIQEALIVPVGFHVDYWNYIGWTDRFSSPQFTQRQEAYARRLREGPYTPQVVVDGTNQFVGSDRRALFAAIATAARKPKSLRVQIIRDKNNLRVLVDGPFSGSSDVLLAIIQNDAETRVARGENGGKVLRHAAIARNLQVIGESVSQKWERTLPLNLPQELEANDSRAIVFVQSPATGEVLGATSISLQSAK